MLVMTWNVENLFRPGDEFGPDTAATYQAKIEALALTINSAGPTLVGLQEVGDPDALEDLVTALNGDWHTVTSGHFDIRHPIRVAVISRLPLEVAADVAAFPADLAPVHADDTGTPVTAMGRGALAVHVNAGGDGAGLLFVTCHLKSKLLSYPAPPGRSRFQPRDEAERARTAAYALNRRAAEAVTVRRLVDELLDGFGTQRRLVLCGDLNDEVQAATTQILLGPPGSEFGTAGADRPDKGDNHRLWNIAAMIAESQRFSRVYQGRRELIDHIMVSHALHKRIAAAGTIAAAGLTSIGDDPEIRRQAGDSDHAPVLADLDI
ncbi:endonuclease/exonuclease/phosphatase family protein [Plantactinospora sp. CA-294935]|uniref:endonuclease/exonuclease/phosphatase family protein n=1 Tax=Plantactinospora sp. CA-294935 TaxID=3240012 RepID=UPI003D92F35B